MLGILFLQLNRFKQVVKNTIIACLAVLFLQPSIASAKDETNAVSLRKMFFGKANFSAQEPMRADPYNIVSFLAPPPACESHVRNIIELVERYADFAAIEKSRAMQTTTDQAFQDITDYMKNKVGGTNRCLEPVLQGYFIASFQLLQLGPIEYRKNADRNYISSLGPTLLAAYLARTGRITFLRNSSDSNASQEKLGTIAGGYSCIASKVYLTVAGSIEQLPRPFDAGSKLAHEQDHLLRDKSLSLEKLKEKLPSKNGSEVDWNQYVALDEGLAVLLTATEQREAAFGQSGKVGASRDADNHWHSDFSMLNPHGNFEKLNRGLNFSLNAMDTLSNRWDSDDGREILESTLPKDQDQLLGKIFGYIETIYELNQGDPVSKKSCPGDASSRLLRITRNPQDLPYAKSYWRALSGQDQNADSVVRITPIPPFDHYWVSRKGNEVYLPFRGTGGYSGPIDAADFLQSLSVLAKKLETPTEACLAFEAAIDAGKVPGYVGTKVAKRLKSMQEIRFAGNGIKLDGNGVKPDGNGVKPDGNGVKPGLSITPCLDVKP
jgi:hypothetical protein